MVLIVDQNENTYKSYLWAVVWTRIGRYVFGNNEKVYFWKGISVDRT